MDHTIEFHSLSRERCAIDLAMLARQITRLAVLWMVDIWTWILARVWAQMGTSRRAVAIGSESFLVNVVDCARVSDLAAS